jgi:ribosomal protein S7
MLKSEAERIVRRALEDTSAQFTQEQIDALCIMSVKIATTIVEEAIASLRQGSGRKGFFSD